MGEPRPVLSARADADLNAITAFIAERDGFLRATTAIERIRKTMHNLAFMPGIGRRRDDLGEGMRAFPVSPWVIYYVPLPADDGIRALRIVDSRRDVASIFRR